MKLSTILSFGIVAALPSLASAHTGVEHAAGFSTGFGHPFSGLDHLLVMVAVGLWASQQGGRARILLPLVFVTVMAAGAVGGSSGLALPLVEHGILASVFVLGLLVALAARLPLGGAVALTAVFALFHGHAHGAEAPLSGSMTAYGIGFVTATALLHLAGLLGAGLAHRPAQLLAVRAAGGLTAIAGLVLAWG